MEQTQKRTAIERFLGLFTEVKRGEAGTALLMMLNVFLILTAYLIAKVVREPLIIVGGGAEIKSYAAAGQVILLAIAVRVYAWLVATFDRKKLINYVTLFFTGCLVLFYILAWADVPIGVVFFLWVGIFSLMIIAQFWSFANDIYSEEAGKRLFVLIGFGASAGGVFGPMIADALIEPVGIYQLLLVSAGILFVSLMLINYIDTRTHSSDAEKDIDKTSQSEEKISKSGAFKVVFQAKYLFMIAMLILLTNWVNTNGEYILSRSVEKKSKTDITSETIEQDVPVETDVAEVVEKERKTFVGKFYARFYTIVGAAGLFLQLFAVSRIIKYLGVRSALMILPLIAFGGYILIAFIPVLHIIRWPKTLENATDYSLNNTVRHILFLPTTREQKYKAKVAIDSFFVRAGDVLSALVVYVGVTWLSFQIPQFAFVNIFLVAFWLFLAFRIGTENKKMQPKEASS